MGESRQELLQWLNQLLQLNLTKVEQCGTGAPLCQVYDSIFLDVPMSKVKFSVNTEYAYLANFKILTNTFAQHGVDRPIPVDRLVKCKMQDNLEFLQWTKKYWDQYFPGGDYDPLSRRKGQATVGGPAPTSSLRTSTNSRPSAAASGARRGVPSNAAASRAPRPGSATSGAQTAALASENNQLKETVEGLERERDFYFAKLRDIEIMLQQEVEAKPELEQDEGGLIPRMQQVLYSTEDGFEIPAEGEDGLGGDAAAEEETF